jgi:ABC-type multidrug transport system permease subunit
MSVAVIAAATFISNAFVPKQHMPGWLQTVANWNPLSVRLYRRKVL